MINVDTVLVTVMAQSMQVCVCVCVRSPTLSFYPHRPWENKEPQGFIKWVWLSALDSDIGGSL